MYKYQNVSKRVQTIVIAGDINPRVVKPDQEVISSVAIENPNFKYIGRADQSNGGGIVGEQVPQSSAVTEAEMIAEQTNKENQ